MSLAQLVIYEMALLLSSIFIRQRQGILRSSDNPKVFFGHCDIPDRYIKAWRRLLFFLLISFVLCVPHPLFHHLPLLFSLPPPTSSFVSFLCKGILAKIVLAKIEPVSNSNVCHPMYRKDPCFNKISTIPERNRKS